MLDFLAWINFRRSRPQLMLCRLSKSSNCCDIWLLRSRVTRPMDPGWFEGTVMRCSKRPMALRR